MATGRTISANHITEIDRQVLELCKSISLTVKELIKNQELKVAFWDTFGKISMTRDAGAGRGGGKLQRDALCVRGRQGKAPYSNRNLRWHPLVVAAQKIDFAKPIKRIEIEGEEDSQTLIFVVEINGKEEKFPSDRAHELPERFVVLPEHWMPHINNLRNWNDILWTQNSCIIPAMEVCEWKDALEVYAFLAISVAVEYYNVDFSTIYNKITQILNNQQINSDINLPSEIFPNDVESFLNCPICKKPLSANLENFRINPRIETWQPAWSPHKRSEGEDGSIQILHIEPLIETEIRHKVGKVKFGHRWCNVSMADHSLDETLDFFEYIIRAHNRI